MVGVAQLVEHLVVVQVAAGSSPVTHPMSLLTRGDAVARSPSRGPGHGSSRARVMVGFVNALAILIFAAQVPHLIGVPWAVYPLVAVGHRRSWCVLPRITTAVPAPLVADRRCSPPSPRSFGDRGADRRRPGRAARQPARACSSRTCRSRCETLTIIAPYAFADGARRPARVAHDRQARRRHHRHPLPQDPRGLGPGRRQHPLRLLRRHGRLRDDRPDDDQRQGVAAPAPASRPSSPASSCSSSSSALGDIVAVIPMAALVAVMIMVSVGTFDWHSIRPADPAADADERDARHARHRRGRRRRPTTSPSASSSASSPRWSCSPGASPTSPASSPSPTPTATPRGMPSTASSSSPRATTSSTQFDYAGDPEARHHRPVAAPTSGTPRPSLRSMPSRRSGAQGTTVSIPGLSDSSLERHDRLAGHSRRPVTDRPAPSAPPSARHRQLRPHRSRRNTMTPHPTTPSRPTVPCRLGRGL